MSLERCKSGEFFQIFEEEEFGKNAADYVLLKVGFDTAENERGVASGKLKRPPRLTRASGTQHQRKKMATRATMPGLEDAALQNSHLLT